MKKNMKAMCLLAMALACAPAFAGEAASTQAAPGGHHAATVKRDAIASTAGKKAEAGKQQAKAVARKVTGKEVGQEAVCPVTGEKFKVTAKTLSASYKGNVYYFCCPGCAKPFLADPEKFLVKKQAAQGKIYVCPMGDYQGNKPGKCPKCGMQLVEKK